MFSAEIHKRLTHPLLAALLAASLLNAGCASKSPDPEPAATEEEAAQASENASPTFGITIVCKKKSLRTLLEKQTLLRDYQKVDDLDDAEIERLLVLAERDARDLLGSQGYFSPEIQLRQEHEDGQLQLVMEVESGPSTKVREVNIDFEGEIASTSDVHAIAQRDRIRDEWTLPAGKRFTQDAWSSAKTNALRQLVEYRYPQGLVSFSVAEIDRDEASARLTVRLDSGPPYFLGSSTVKGDDRYPAVLAERLSWLKPGDVYDQKRLIDAQQRLAGSGYYQSAFINMDVEGDPEAAPVRYFVREAKRKKLATGIGYSTDGGPRLTFEHRNNNFWGSNWRSDTRLHLERKEPLIEFGLTSLPNANGWARSGLARAMRQDDGTLTTTTKSVRVGILKNRERYDRNFYFALDHASVTGSGDRQVPSALLGDGAAISANYAWTGRYFDNIPYPTHGYGLGVDAGVGMTLIGKSEPFTRVNGRWLGIVPAGKGGSRFALRGELGAILANKQARVPSIYMYRTGGNTTVRGYGYRKLGINVGQGLTGPGRYMFAGSAEWQRPILQDKLPGLLEHVFFVDVGGVANEFNRLSAHWGVGTGVRLITPVGPMQLDLGYGLQKPRGLRLHMNVGFTF